MSKWVVEYEGGIVPFHEEDGEVFLTGLQVAQDPQLAAFVERYKANFRLPHDRDVYIWEPPKKVDNG